MNEDGVEPSVLQIFEALDRTEMGNDQYEAKKLRLAVEASYRSFGTLHMKGLGSLESGLTTSR